MSFFSPEAITRGVIKNSSFEVCGQKSSEIKKEFSFLKKYRLDDGKI